MRLRLRPEYPVDRPSLGELGITVVLTMVLLLGVSVVLLSLISATSDNIRNSENVQVQGATENALDDAATTALQLARYDPATCSSVSQSYPALGPAVSALCEITYRDQSRYATVYVCARDTCSSSTSALTVVVSFVDSSECGQAGPDGPRTEGCGEDQTVESWAYRGND